MRMWLQLVLAVSLFVSCTMAREGAASDWSAPAEAEFSGEDAMVAKLAAEAPSAPIFERAALRSAAPEPAQAPAQAQGQTSVERQVIYTATLQLVVVSVYDASNSVLSIAKAAGGYLQSSDAHIVTVRVPAAKFDAVLAQCEKLGEVVGRNVNASDVTEQVLELDIRLDNAKRARERLLAHLEKSEKMEDTLKIEAELARVTLEIERIEGQLRYLRSQISMSTITVILNSRVPQGSPNDGLAIPFEWVKRLGDGLMAGAVEAQPRKPNFLTRGPSFTPPPEFLRYYSSHDLVEAMNAEGVRVKVQRHSNYDEGALGFWTKLARQALVEGRSVVFAREQNIDDERAVMVGSRDVSGEPYGYLLLILRSPKRVFTFEAWGPAEAFNAQRAALEQSALSLRP